MIKVLRWIGYLLLGLLLLLAVVPLLIPVPPLTNTLPPRALADPDSRFIEVNGLEVHYKKSGQGQPAIILLHGFGASTFSWREVMADLAEAGTVVAFDRPAFGLTERPLPSEWEGENPYSPEAQVALLFGLMDSLRLEQAILVGNSAGGTVAMKAALASPERVQALVLVDPAVYNSGGSPAWIRPLLHLPQMERPGVLLARSLSTRGMEILIQAWHDPGKITDTVKEGYRRPLRAENWDMALWQLTKTSQASNLAQSLDQFAMPVLVVTGDDDRIVPTSDSQRLAEEIPAARLVVFEHCGHVPQEECPAQFLEAVLPFIRAVSTDASTD